MKTHFLVSMGYRALSPALNEAHRIVSLILCKINALRKGIICQ